MFYEHWFLQGPARPVNQVNRALARYIQSVEPGHHRNLID